jgi:capsular exopolysaccharide synthesis family protein
MDLRAPKLLEYLNLSIENPLGVTNFIIDDNLTVDDIILKKPTKENIDVILSGDIPPNPSELLLDIRIKQLFEQLKERYDYIIIDTAPVGVVTDTILMSDFADATLYIVKAEYIDKRMLNVPLSLYHEKRLKNMALLLNGTDIQKGYGYGYGYGYGNYMKGEAKQSFFAKVKQKLFKPKA